MALKSTLFCSWLLLIITYSGAFASLPSCVLDCDFGFMSCAHMAYHCIEGCARDCFEEIDPSVRNESVQFLLSIWSGDEASGGLECEGPLYESARPECLDTCDLFTDCNDLSFQFSSFSNGCAFDCGGDVQDVKYLDTAWKYGSNDGQSQCNGPIPSQMHWDDLPSCLNACGEEIRSCTNLFDALNKYNQGCAYRSCQYDEVQSLWERRCEGDLQLCDVGYTGIMTENRIAVCVQVACDPNPCMNGGSCVPAVDAPFFSCDCATQHYGDTCQQTYTCNIPQNVANAASDEICIGRPNAVEIIAGETCVVNCLDGYASRYPEHACPPAPSDPSMWSNSDLTPAPALLSCEPRSCDVPLRVENSASNGVCSGLSRLHHEETCLVQCATGFHSLVEEVKCSFGTLISSDSSSAGDAVTLACFQSPCDASSITVDDAPTSESCIYDGVSTIVPPGESCITRCDAGYYPSISELECDLGQIAHQRATLNPSSFSCISFCPVPALAALSQLHVRSIAGVCETESQIRRGQQCEMICDDGYEPVDTSAMFRCRQDTARSSVLVSLQSDTRTPYHFECVPKSCTSTQVVAFGPGVISGNTCVGNGTSIPHGTTCAPRCSSGYVSRLSEHSSETLISLYCDLGVLRRSSSVGEPVTTFGCFASPCPIPANVAHAFLYQGISAPCSNTDPHQTEVEPGSTCVPQCETGYRSTVDNLRCPSEGGGLLIPSTFECVPRLCEVGLLEPFGLASSAWFCHETSTTIEHGASCSVRCPVGFVPSFDENADPNALSATGLMAECRFGDIFPQRPVCLPIGCVQPGGVASISASGPCRGIARSERLMSGGTCETSCSDGYLASVREIQCYAGSLTPPTFSCIGLRYLGCYEAPAHATFAFDFEAHPAGEVTEALTCGQLCERFAFFAIRNGGSCLCGSFSPVFGVSTDASACNELCMSSGDNFPCGDVDHFAVYETPGRYFRDRVAHFDIDEHVVDETSKFRIHAELRLKLRLADPSQSVRMTDDELRNVARTDLTSAIHRYFVASGAEITMLDLTLGDVILASPRRREGRFVDSSTSFGVSFRAGVVARDVDPDALTHLVSAGSFATVIDSAWDEVSSVSDVDISGTSGAYESRYGCWQLGMALELPLSVQDDATIDWSRFDTSCASTSGTESLDCCYSLCLDDLSCIGVHWRSDRTCGLYQNLPSAAVVPPKIVRDATFHDGIERISATRLRMCNQCWMPGYGVLGSVRSISSVPQGVSRVKCGQICANDITCEAVLFSPDDGTCQIVEIVDALEPSDFPQTGSIGMFSDDLCQNLERLPVPCSLPSSVYPSCASVETTALRTHILPSDDACSPSCHEGFSPSVDNFTCSSGILRSLPTSAEIRCHPNPCSLDSSLVSDAHCDEGPAISSGERCSVSCDDPSLRPNIESLDCLNGAFITLSSDQNRSFECALPCAASANGINCVEGPEIKSTEICTPLCPHGKLPDARYLQCNDGTLSPPSFSCVDYALVGLGTTRTFDELLETRELESRISVSLPLSDEGAAERECVMHCIRDSVYGTGLCASASVVLVSEEGRAMCYLFASSSRIASLDLNVEFSATFNVGEYAVRQIENQIAGPNVVESSDHIGATTCIEGYVAVPTPQGVPITDVGFGCAFAQSLGECYAFECPDPSQHPCRNQLSCVSGEQQYDQAFGSTESCVVDDCNRKWWDACASCDGYCNYVVDYVTMEGAFVCVQVDGDPDATHCNVDLEALRTSGNYVNVTCSDTMAIGDACEFDCADGFDSSGDGRMLCLPGGILESELCLASCPTRGQMPGSHRCGMTLKSGEMCQFQCPVNFAPSGDGYVFCSDGVMNGAGQSCMFAAGCSGVLEGIQNITNVHSHNCSENMLEDTSCEGTCREGFMETVDIRAECNNAELHVQGLCEPHPHRCDPEALRQRINMSTEVVCEAQSCSLISCQAGWVVANGAVPMECSSGLIDTGDLVTCVERSSSQDTISCPSPRAWLTSTVPRSAETSCGGSLDDGASCSFACEDGFTYKAEAGVDVSHSEVEVKCEGGQLSLRVPGTCVKVPCAIGQSLTGVDRIASALGGSSLRAQGVESITCEHLDDGNTTCFMRCNSNYVRVAHSETLDCVRSSSSAIELRLLDVNLDTQAYCSPRSCEMSNIVIEHSIRDDCEAILASGESCRFECPFGFVALNDISCEFGRIHGDRMCVRISDVLRTSAAVAEILSDKEAHPNIFEVELNVRMSIQASSAYEVVRLIDAAKVSCEALIDETTEFGESCEVHVLSVSKHTPSAANDLDDDVRMLIRVIDSYASIATMSAYDSFRESIASRMLSVAENANWRHRVARVDELSASIQFVESGVITADNLSLAEIDSTVAANTVAGAIGVPTEDLFGRRGVVHQFRRASDNANRWIFSCVWSADLHQADIDLSDSSIDILALLDFETLVLASRGVEHVNITAVFDASPSLNVSDVNFWSNVALRIGVVDCTLTEIVVVPTSKHAGIVRCVGLPSTVQGAYIGMKSVGMIASSNNISLGRTAYVTFPQPIQRSSTRVSTSVTAGSDSGFVIVGENFGNQNVSILISLILSTRTAELNEQYCSNQMQQYGRCVLDISPHSIHKLDSTRIHVNLTQAVVTDGWFETSFFGNAFAHVILVAGSTAPAYAASSSSETSWLALDASMPIVTSIEPDTLYRNQILTIHGDNFGHVAPDNCEAMSVLLGSVECTFDDADASVGWRSNTEVTCRVQPGVKGELAHVVVRRESLASSDRVFFNYAGDHIPLTTTDVEMSLANARSRGERVRVAITCAETGVYSVIDPYGRSAEEMFEAACPNDVVGSAVVIPANAVEVTNITALDSVCENTDDSIMCDTRGSSGAMSLRLTGNNFRELGVSRVVSVFIDGVPQHFEAVGDVVFVSVPEGVGMNREISVIDIEGFVDRSSTLSYRAPIIDSIRGCDDSANDGRTDECDKSQDTLLTIYGDYFGPERIPLQTLIGGSLCVNTYHDTASPHEKIYCTLTSVDEVSGNGWLPVTVLSLNQASTPSPILRYRSCRAGTILRDGSCEMCQAGTFNPRPGLLTCLPCAYGKFASEAGMSACEECAAGTYRDEVGGTECTDCPSGHFSSTRGNRNCAPCFPGTYVAAERSSMCLSCDVGTFQSTAGATECVECLPGTFTSSPGSRRCEDCRTSFYCPGGMDAVACTISERGGSLCDANGMFEPSECPQGSYCPDTQTKRPCYTYQLCPAGQGTSPRVCVDPNAKVETSGEDSRCICQYRYFGVAQDVDVAIDHALEASSTLNSDDLRMMLDSLWIESKWHNTLEDAMIARQLTLDDEIAYDMNFYDQNDDGVLNETEVRQFAVLLKSMEPLLQCFPCRRGMTCYSETYDKSGIVAETVEAAPGFWGNRVMFFENNKRETWGSALEFEQCDAIVKTPSSIAVPACMGGKNWSSCISLAQSGPLCSVCSDDDSTGFWMPSYTQSLSGECVSCDDEAGRTATVRATLFLGCLVGVLATIFAFNRFVHNLDRALDEGRLVAGSRVERLLRLRRRYKASKKGKRRRSSHAINVTPESISSPISRYRTLGEEAKTPTKIGIKEMVRNEQLRCDTSVSSPKSHSVSIASTPTETRVARRVSPRRDASLSPRSKWRRQRERASRRVLDRETEYRRDDDTENVLTPPHHSHPRSPSSLSSHRLTLRLSPRQRRQRTAVRNLTLATWSSNEGDWLSSGDRATPSALDGQGETAELDPQSHDTSPRHRRSPRKRMSPRRKLSSPTSRRLRKTMSKWEYEVYEDVRAAEDAESLDHYYHHAPPERPNVWIKVKLLISFYQLLILHQRQVALSWPSEFLSLMRPLYVLDFNLFSLPFISCLVRYNFWVDYFIQMTLPLVCVALMFAFAEIAPRVCARGCKSWSRVDASRYSLIILFFVFTTCSRFAVDSLTCVELSDRNFYLRSNLEIQCYEGTHLTLMPVLYIVALVYVLGVPSLFFVLLWNARRRDALYNTAGVRDIQNRVVEVNEDTSRWLGVAYYEYTRDTWWFEIVLFVHKFLLIAAYAYEETIARQLFLACALHTVFTVTLVAYVSPFRERGDGAMLLASLGSLILITAVTYDVDLAMYNEQASNEFDTAALFLVLLSICPIFAMVAIILRTSSRNACVRSFAKNVLCGFCVSSDLSARLTSGDRWLDSRLRWFEERLDVARFNFDCQRMTRKLARQTQQLAIQLAFVDEEFARLDLLKEIKEKQRVSMTKIKSSRAIDRTRTLSKDGTLLLCSLVEETLTHVASYAARTNDVLLLNIARTSVARLLFALAPWDDRSNWSGHGCWYWYDLMSDRVVEVTPTSILNLSLAMEDVEALLWRLLHKKRGIETVRYRRFSSRRSRSSLRKLLSSSASTLPTPPGLTRPGLSNMPGVTANEEAEAKEDISSSSSTVPESPRKKRRTKGAVAVVVGQNSL